mmetsp:Transcript_14411/g.43596  ORF Transcript_14411/g.43596 Transcript_14411/m.43596 type:complete len:101 (+) Transcript_14411:2038-2340(+)
MQMHALVRNKGEKAVIRASAKPAKGEATLKAGNAKTDQECTEGNLGPGSSDAAAAVVDGMDDGANNGTLPRSRPKVARRTDVQPRATISERSSFLPEIDE